MATICKFTKANRFISGNSMYFETHSFVFVAGAVRYTGGNLFYYPKFNASLVEETMQFERDLVTFLSRPVGFEAVLRIRASKGLQLSAYHGNFFLRSSDLLSLPNVSPDNSYAVQISIEERLRMPEMP
jgi:protein transport protein SEC24